MGSLVKNSEELKDFLLEAEKHDFITIDTEFLRERTYFPELCLIQIGFGDTAFAIDYLDKDMDFSPLISVLKNPKITKVLHACDQDILIFKNEFGFIPAPLFDTQVAAGLLGYGDTIGYGNLVKKICNTNIDKSQRFTDWSARPLSEEQIKYAVSDVTYLRDIYLKLKQELKEKNREEWMTQEMSPYLENDFYENKPEEMWRSLKVKNFDGTSVAIAKSLAKWREKKAIRKNKPRNWVLRNDAILEIIAKNPKRPEDLKEGRFFKFKNPDIRCEIFNIVEEGRKDKPINIKNNFIILNDTENHIIDLLKLLLKLQAQEFSISSKYIANIDDIEKFYCQFKSEKIKTHKLMQNWRYQVFGKKAEELLSGKLAFKVGENQNIVLQ